MSNPFYSSFDKILSAEVNGYEFIKDERIGRLYRLIFPSIYIWTFGGNTYVKSPVPGVPMAAWNLAYIDVRKRMANEGVPSQGRRQKAMQEVYDTAIEDPETLIGRAAFLEVL